MMHNTIKVLPQNIQISIENSSFCGFQYSNCMMSFCSTPSCCATPYILIMWPVIFYVLYCLVSRYRTACLCSLQQSGTKLFNPKSGWKIFRPLKFLSHSWPRCGSLIFVAINIDSLGGFTFRNQLISILLVVPSGQHLHAIFSFLACRWHMSRGKRTCNFYDEKWW